MFTKLKSAWPEVNKRAIGLFSGFIFLTWLMFIIVFWALFKFGNMPSSSGTSASSGNDSIPITAAPGKPGITMHPFEPEFLSTFGTKHPEDLYAHKQLMEILLKKGKISESFAHHERAAEFFKDDTAFIRNSAQLFLNIGEYKNALEMTRKGLDLRPEDKELKNIEINALYRLGRVKEAIETAETEIKSRPKDLELLTLMGMMSIESESGKPGNDKYLRTALRLNPKYTPALYQLGRKHQLEGNFGNARNTFQKIIEEEPANARARGHLGAVYFYLQQDDLALKEYQTALELNPSDFNTWYNLGELYLAKGYSAKLLKGISIFRQKAFSSYQECLELYPDHNRANFRIGVLLNGNKQYKEAIRHFEKVLNANPDDVRALIQIAVASEQLGRTEEAVDYLQRAFRIDPRNPTVLHKLRLLS